METKRYRQIAFIGIGVYLAALITISLVFKEHALQLKWMLWGIGEVLFFFVLTAIFYPRWKNDDPKCFRRKVFWTALGIRAVYAFVICYYYYYQTGKAFEYGAADSLWYHPTGVFLSKAVRHGHIRFVFQYLRGLTMGFSDQGYVLWLTLIYTIFGRNLLTPRLFKALMSAYLCIVVYKLGTRTLGERTGRLAAVLCVFMPILIQACGLHTKEMEMIFLSILALERMDYLIRSKKYTVWNIAFPILLTGLTFGFRTIIGMCLIFAFFVFILLSPRELVSKKGKIITVSATVLVFLVFLFTGIGREMKIIYKLKFMDLNAQTEKYETLGMKHGELAQSKYLFPGAFVLPLAPMVEESPDHNKMIHGSTFVKNFLAFFAMLALVVVFRQKKWRDFSLIGAYVLSYLAIIMFSFTANSERFHEPVIPLLVLMSAYAMTHLQCKDLKLFRVYCVVLFAALLVWNWLKISARESDPVELLMNKLAVIQVTEKDNTVSIRHDLPEEYQEVEYIESTGKQWINTGIPLNTNYTLYNDGCIRQDRMGQLICGFYNINNRFGTCFYAGTGNKLTYFWVFEGRGQLRQEILQSDTKIDVTHRLQIIQNKSAFVCVQGNVTYTAHTDYNPKKTKDLPDTSPDWTIFKSIGTGLYVTATTGVLYEGKIWNENDKLIAHYIPCYRKADNEIGLYDMVSGAFLTNAGSGTFLKGVDVENPMIYDSVVGYNRATKNNFSK